MPYSPRPSMEKYKGNSEGKGEYERREKRKKKWEVGGENPPKCRYSG